MKTGFRHLVVIGVASMLALSGCSTGAPVTSKPSNGPSVSDLNPITPKPTGALAKVVWNLPNGEPQSLDPKNANDNSINTVVANLCEPLWKMNPDFSRAPGLALSVDWASPTEAVYKIRPDVKFWNGEALTADDVAFSLNRNLNPQEKSHYASRYVNVESITATGPLEVTVKLKTPDVIFDAFMSTDGGAISNKAFVTNAGAAYGTATGKLMCTGPYALDEWRSGQDISIVRNDSYWDSARKPLVKKVVFKFITNESTMISALSSDEIQGTYDVPLAGASQLEAQKAGKLYLGPSSEFTVMMSFKQTDGLANPKIRQAVRALIDYKGIIEGVYQGSARVQKAAANPGSWGYAQEAYAAAYKELPAVETDLALAKRLIAEAGPANRTLTIAYPAGVDTYTKIATSVQSSAKEVGLTIDLKGLPIEQFVGLFSNPDARVGLDGLIANSFVLVPEPLDMYNKVAGPKGSGNFVGYDNADVHRLIAEARATTDEAKRADIVIEAQKQITADTPWIPIVQTPTRLFMTSTITGAPSTFAYFYYPWAADLGKP